MSKPARRGEESGVRSQDLRRPALPCSFVFVGSPDDVRDPAAIVVRIPRGIRSKKKLFAIYADKLRFPDYFGWNWDAFEECLRDLSWLPAGQAIIIVHEDLPFGAGGKSRGIYVDILCGALDHWPVAHGRKVQVVVPSSWRGELNPATTGQC
jgi:barstar (barnase inhibitor)